MKKANIFFFVLIASSLLGCARTIEFKDETSHVEYGEKINNDDIKGMLANPEVLPEKYAVKLDGKDIDHNKIYDIGNYTLTIEYDDVSLDHSIEVSDTKAPTITQNTSDIEINKQIDLKSLFTVKDESSVEYSVEGNVDFAKTGTYTITVKAEDSEGNKTNSDFDIRVRDYKAEEAAKQAEEQKKAEEERAAREEELADDAENAAYDYIALYYPDISFGVDEMLQSYTTNMGDEYVVQFPCKIENVFGEETRHSLVVYVAVENNEIKGVSRIALDGEQIK